MSSLEAIEAGVTRCHTRWRKPGGKEALAHEPQSTPLLPHGSPLAKGYERRSRHVRRVLPTLPTLRGREAQRVQRRDGGGGLGYERPATLVRSESRTRDDCRVRRPSDK